MNFILDTHIHTVSSGHAYSTIHDYILEAKEKGLELIGITDHAPKMPGGPHLFHFGNMRVFPKTIDGIEVLRGAEVNILDEHGTIDMPNNYLEKLDIVIASLHDVVIDPMTQEKNTRAFINVMKNKYIDVIGHPGNPVFSIDKDLFVKSAKKHNVLIEINNSSFKGSRIGSKEHCIEILRLAKKYNAKVIAGTDSHISYDVGNFDAIKPFFKEIDFPQELIMNTSVSKLKNYLKEKRSV